MDGDKICGADIPIGTILIYAEYVYRWFSAFRIWTTRKLVNISSPGLLKIWFWSNEGVKDYLEVNVSLLTGPIFACIEDGPFNVIGNNAKDLESKWSHKESHLPCQKQTF